MWLVNFYDFCLVFLFHGVCFTQDDSTSPILFKCVNEIVVYR